MDSQVCVEFNACKNAGSDNDNEQAKRMNSPEPPPRRGSVNGYSSSSSLIDPPISWALQARRASRSESD
jgi:hypothetical protein